MAEKNPDTVSMRYASGGGLSTVILTFSTENLDNTDTVDLAKWCGFSVIEFVKFQCTTSDAVGIALSGTGDTTATFDTDANNLLGRLFVLGTP